MPHQHQASQIGTPASGMPTATGHAANDLDFGTTDAEEPSTDIVARFLEPLGLSRADYELLTSGGLDAEVTNAVYAVHEVAKSDKSLGDRLRRTDQKKHGIIKIVAQRHQGADELADDLIGNLPSLILFGSQGYAQVVDTMIEQMESAGGEGRLSLPEDQRYQHLKAHQKELARLWRADRKSAAVWQQLTNTILRLAAGLAHVQAAEDAEERGRQQGVPYHGEPGHG